MQFQTVVTDANGKRKVSYRDAQGLITAVQEFNRGQSIWTSSAYDALKQITQVRDDRGNLTRAEYDNLGRRIVLDNPDTGRTEHRFDLAGNLVEKVTANLRAQGKAIRYGYDYGRLATISYPNNPENNVSYRYGAPGEAYGRAGRIAEVTSQSGREERYYGRLGEVVKEVRTVSSDRGAPQQAWVTEYLFDTFGRLQRLVYPDGEVLSYGYDAGGNLSYAQGQKGGTSTTYLARLEYDQFEQRRYVAYGNGSHSEYRYDPRNRRLANLRAEVQGRAFQDLGYSYDNVGNILGLQNRVPVPGANSYGGPTNQVFQYDDLYRLVQAQGSYDFAPNKRDRYSLAMAYDSIHNITGKTQVHDVVNAGGQAVGQKKASYAWAYAYGGVQPHAPTHLGERTYRYDANRNQLGWDHDKNGTRRNIVWDEENRIQSIFDNGQQQAYKYDDAGDRVVKRGPQGETVYVNQWFTVRNREVASKHVYAGSSRIATLLVPGVKPAPGGTGTIAGSGLPTGALQAPGILQGQGLAKRSAQAAAHSRNLEKNPHYAGGGSAPPSNEHFLYYYHPDHLGSSSYITDGNGKIYQHMEYFPFGETWVDESSNTQRTPYLFTGKELDEETGLQYFGARYYDPRTSVWLSPDPNLGNYLDGTPAGGVYNAFNSGLYG